MSQALVASDRFNWKCIAEGGADLEVNSCEPRLIAKQVSWLQGKTGKLSPPKGWGANGIKREITVRSTDNNERGGHERAISGESRGRSGIQNL